MNYFDTLFLSLQFIFSLFSIISHTLPYPFTILLFLFFLPFFPLHLSLNELLFIILQSVL